MCAAMHGGYVKMTWISPEAARAIERTLATAGEPACPCPICNRSDHRHAPEMPKGYRDVFSTDGWID
jgi:hypothetical protein